MFKIRIRIAILFIIVSCSSTQVLGQAAEEHFFIHGWGGSPSQMNYLGGEMQSEFVWPDAPIYPDYTNLGTQGINHGTSNNIKPALTNVYPTAVFVGLGYSAGGLFARELVREYNSTVCSGVVTLDAPNNGTPLANWGARAAYLAHAPLDYAQMQRGEHWWWTLLIGPAYALLEIPAQLINAIGQILLGVVNDMDPSSNFLGLVNSSSQPPQKRVAVWNDVTYPYMAYYSDDVNGGCSWQTRINTARANSHSFDQNANNIQSRMHFYQLWKWPSIWYNRMRAGDWSAAANGQVDLEEQWEKVTAGQGQPSDGFIGTSSQQHIPSATAIVHGNQGVTTKGLGVDCGPQDGPRYLNHGDVIYLEDPAYLAHIHSALVSAGAH